ncbi:MAG: hypothetical protein GY818_21470 [Planctomycetaceae bacterium]|nr:hypothetical protein [Planctomycetaceae bacterium]
MNPQINHFFVRTGLACWLLLWCATFSHAQKTYPTSRYRGQQLLEDQQVYDLGSQLYSDSSSDFQAMSPDRWSIPPVGARPTIVSRIEEVEAHTPIHSNKKLMNSIAFKKPRDLQPKSKLGESKPVESKPVESKPVESKSSYWSQAGIEISSKREDRVRPQQSPRLHSERKPNLKAGYPLRVSARQEISETSKGQVSNGPVLTAPASNQKSWRPKGQNVRKRVSQSVPHGSGESDWNSHVSRSSALDLGFRRPEITRRPTVEYSPSSASFASDSRCDCGETDSPTLEEILRTGRYFGSANVSFLKPVLQGDIAYETSGSAGRFQDNFEYDYSTASQFSVGFESQAGPGFSINYWEFDGVSDAASWTSGDVSSGETIVGLGGVLGGRQFTVFDFNDTVTVNDSLDVQSIEASLFKEMKFKVSRMGGRLGFQWVEINRQTNASFTDVGGSTVAWEGKDQFQGAGPTFGFDYFRPIGHTKIEFHASSDFGLIFGQRDKVVRDNFGAINQNLSDDEFFTNLDLFLGAQYVISRGGNRCFYFRSGLDYQVWLGADNEIASNSDFGLRGFSLTLGYNR